MTLHCLFRNLSFSGSLHCSHSCTPVRASRTLLLIYLSKARPVLALLPLLILFHTSQLSLIISLVPHARILFSPHVLLAHFGEPPLHLHNPGAYYFITLPFGYESLDA